MEAVDYQRGPMEGLKREIFDPPQCAELMPVLRESADPFWLYRYTDPVRNWQFCVATHGQPGSGSLSLGGFRIVPEERATIEDFDPRKEALGLAIGMEGKVSWSRICKVGGPLGLNNLSRIVGGKCVLLPTVDARVGKANDFALLDFAVMCCKDFESHSGVYLNTGQDLGHGVMSDGTTTSLEYLHREFTGSILADTSKPTAEGNVYVVLGALSALQISHNEARVGLIGCGNIGSHVLERLRELGVEVFAVEASEVTRKRLKEQGVSVSSPSEKMKFLSEPMDVLVVNANGGTLDNASIEVLSRNARLQVITGCENLIMPDPAGIDLLRESQKVFCPTEFCGMMGYITAVEEYLADLEDKEFELEEIFSAAKRIEVPTTEAIRLIHDQNHSLTFSEAVRKVCSSGC